MGESIPPKLDPATLDFVHAFYEHFQHVRGTTIRFDTAFRDIAETLRRAFGAAQVTLWVPNPLGSDPDAGPPPAPAAAASDAPNRAATECSEQWGMTGGAVTETHGFAAPETPAGGVMNPAFTTFPAELAGQIPKAAPLATTRPGRAFVEGRAHLYRSLDDAPPAPVPDMLRAAGLSGMWAIPLRSRTLRFGTEETNPHNIAAVAICTFAHDAWALDLYAETLAFFGGVCGRVLERALWAEQDLVVQKAYEALDTVESNRFAAMGNVAKAIRDAMQFEACTILQAENAREVLHIVGTTGIDSRVPQRKMQYAYGFSCSGWVAQRRRTLAVEDMRDSRQYDGPLYTDRVQSADRFQYLGTPLLSNAGELLGVIRVRNKLAPVGNTWPRFLNYLDRVRIERVAKVIAPLISHMIKEKQTAATMERIRHDIDMPAMAIRDGAGVLRRRPDEYFAAEVEQLRQKLEDIESFADILLVNSELMGLSSSSELPFHPENVLPLGGFVAKLCKMLNPAARRKGLAGILYNQGSFFVIPSLWLDPRLFQIAMYNLLQNALKYSDPGAMISVEGEAVRIDAQTWYLIHVKNSGMGVTDDELPHIFERNYRSRRASRRSDTGLGIGLSTARELIERHGGRLELTRQADPTVFTMQLPGYLADRKPD